MAFILLCISSIAFIFLLASLLKSLKKQRIPRPRTAASDVPTVSICIPARNEMHALTECLERVLASTYPKLEVLVLDDASQDETSIIIKSFAHAGVRFVPGKPLPAGWLGRNYALETLVREASGAYVIFMDVDTFVAPRTVDELIGYGLGKNKAMVSVIPRRYDAYRANVLFGTLRYFWQLVLSGAKRVPVSSSLWLAKRDTLLDILNRLSAFGSEIEPEQKLAQEFKDKYSCVISDEELGVGYEKRWKSQIDTGRRLLFPLFGKNLTGFLSGVLFFALLNVPTAVVLAGFIEWQLANTLATILLIAYGSLYALYAKYVWTTRWWLAVVIWPYTAIQEFLLFIASVWGYTSKSITWKNRSIHARGARNESD